jgi:hypothetical protein
MAFSRSALLAAMAFLLASAAYAQQAPTSEDLVWKLLEIGRVVDPAKTAALFAPMQEQEPYQQAKTEREVKYGPADRHLLDVFTPETAASARPVLIFIHGGAFVGYDKKYGASAFEIRVPAPITESEKALGLELAEKMYRAAGCKGLSRVDFFLDRQGQFWFNEINPFPGCTDTSAFPQSWTKTGLSLGQIVDELVILAFHKSRKLFEVRGKQ